MLENTNTETSRPIIEITPTRSRLKVVAAGLSVGAGLAYLLSKVLRGRSPEATRHQSHESVADNVVDDRGTRQQEAATILRNLRDRAFEASDEKLAVALGRPIEEVAAWNAGGEVIDDDVVMKARGIAMHRGVHVE
jgi:outer membrane receptor for ferric coprogen and ferric-rhodotorulic acid